MNKKRKQREKFLECLFLVKKNLKKNSKGKFPENIWKFCGKLKNIGLSRVYKKIEGFVFFLFFQKCYFKCFI